MDKMESSPSPSPPLWSPPTPEEMGVKDVGRLEAKRQGAVRRKIKRRHPPKGKKKEPSSDFFERFASIRKSYEQSKRRTVDHFRISRKLSHGPVASQLWPTLAGRSVSDLYRKVLVDLVHSFKTEEKCQLLGPPLFTYLQKVFHIEAAEHARLLKAAFRAEASTKVLNLEVVEAKGLTAKDANGLSDPFVTLYILPGDEKHNTSVQFATLQPTWEEYFSIPIKDIQQDVLHVEVWDYDDPDETIVDKFRKLSEVNSSQGLRSLIKEIAFPAAATPGKNRPCDYHGTAQMSLKTIPTNHFDAWFPLRDFQNGYFDDPTDRPLTGQIRLRMTIGGQKDRKVAAQEYRHVLYLLVIKEMDEERHFPEEDFLHQSGGGGWNGHFESSEANTILRRLQHHSGLLPCDLVLAKWLVYTQAQVQSKCCLDTRIFAPLFLSVVDHLNKGAFDGVDTQRFWSAAKGLLQSFAAFVQNIHDIHTFHQVTQSHQMIQTLALLIDLLKSQNVSRAVVVSVENLGGEDGFTIQFIMETMTTAIATGASNFFSKVCADQKDAADVANDMSDLYGVINIGQILLDDLQNGRDFFQRHFQSLLGIAYLDITYRIFDAQYGKMAENLVTKISANLKPFGSEQCGGAAAHGRSSGGVSSNEDEDAEDTVEISTKTTLFELYLALKQFAEYNNNTVSAWKTKNRKILGEHRESEK